MNRYLPGPFLFSIAFCICFLFVATGCREDKLTIDEPRVYVEVRDESAANNPYDGGWRLTLRPDGIADVLPGGDIMYTGKYSIRGSTIKVSLEQISGSYEFQIISEKEIREKKYGTILLLKQ